MAKKLFRGVARTHPAYKNATKLLVKPRNYAKMSVERGSVATLKLIDEHNAGDIDSPFTSWSDFRAVANFFACKSDPPGVVLIKELSDSLYDKIAFETADEFDECEVLLLGEI